MSNLRDRVRLNKSIRKLFSPLKTKKKPDVCSYQVTLFKKKRSSMYINMYSLYKKGKPINRQMRKYVSHLQLMRKHNVNVYITSDWIKQYFGLI